jgi:magnesium chelatase family protein
MTSARTYSAALTGITGHVVTVGADISNGPPGIILAGLPDTALREARDRVRAAVINSGQTWPHRRITVSLSPATLPKHGSGADLAIAIAVLAADGSVPAQATAGVMFVAELGLDGQLRPVPGTTLVSVLRSRRLTPPDPQTTLGPGDRVSLLTPDPPGSP